jgi:hypothetical protein
MGTLKKIRTLALAASVAFASFALGCAHDAPLVPLPSADDPAAALTYRATDLLVGQAVQSLDLDSPVIVATVVDVNNFERSSALGRMVAEHVAGRLTQRGYFVREVNLSESLGFRKEEGELLLTREVQRAAARYSAQAVVVGTYAVGDPSYRAQHAHLSLRLVRPTDGRAISAVDYAIPLTWDIKALIRRNYDPVTDSR